jgi:peptidyl-tRNA hydrolase
MSETEDSPEQLLDQATAEIMQPLQARTVSGHADPEGEAPWAMQMVVRLERDTKATATAVLEAAAQAVVEVLADPASQPGGEWEPLVRRWLSGRIRKVVRRARGAAWERTLAFPGATVGNGGAEVRALVPGPVDAVPPEIAKLQVQGIDLDTSEIPAALDAVEWNGLLVAWNPQVAVSLGKQAAQVAHASNVAWLEASPGRREHWVLMGYPIRVIRPSIQAWESFLAVAPVHINDAGFTEVIPGTLTCAATWVGRMR